MAVERSLVEKLASDMFTDEERGYLATLIDQGEQDNSGDLEKVAEEQEMYIEKVAEEAQGLEDEDLAECLDTLAEAIDPEVQEELIKAAAADIEFELAAAQAEAEELEKVGYEIGVGMRAGFEDAGEETEEEYIDEEEAGGSVLEALGL